MNSFRFFIAVIAVGIITSQTVMMMSNACGQEPAAITPDASAEIQIESIDVGVKIKRLKVLLRPLTAEELQTQASNWLALLRQQIREVGQTELELQTLTEGESDESLRKKLKEQQEEVGQTELELQALTEGEGDESLRDKLVEQRKEVVQTELELQTLTEGESDKSLRLKLKEQREQQMAIVERTQTVLGDLKAKGGDVKAMEQYIAAISDISKTTDSVSYWAAIRGEIRNWAQRDDGGRMYMKRVIVAAVLLIVFWLISKIAGRNVARVLSRHPRASQLLENFARRTVGGAVLVLGVLISLATLGVPIGPLMAALGGGGFIVGFALQETLGNFASGLLIMVYRPFDLNDFVNVAGVEGVVQEMSLVSTSLLTVDNKVLVIPNTKAWGDTIINYTGQETRRVDLVFGISYDDDIQQAIDTLTEISMAHPLVLAEPALNVHVDQLADSSVNIFCRPWVKTSDYWTVHWDLTRQVKERFDQKGISFPYPQRDVHVNQTETSSISQV